MDSKSNQHYTQLSGDDFSGYDEDEYLKDGRSTKLRSERSFTVWKVALLFSTLLNLLLISWKIYSSHPAKSTPRFPGVLHATPPVTRIYTHTSPWSTHDGSNAADLDSRWNSMIDDHGIVAVDHKWAKDYHLPPARDLPSDTSKGLYLIDGYHSLHCLRLLRKAFYQALDDNNYMPFDKSLGHYSHCFDHLKQSITCSSTDNLLAIHYNTTTRATGDWDGVQCKDWSALRDWATAHSPCDNHDPRNSHLPHNICHGGDDRIALSDQSIGVLDVPSWAKDREYEHQPSI